MTGKITSTFSSALLALEFLTPLRLRAVRQYEDRDFGASLAWYPLVGLLIGIVLLLIDRGLEDLLPSGPRSALLLAAMGLLSGGLHFDGLADTADGLAVQGDRATRLGVMSEGNIGPAGVMSLSMVLLVQWSALTALSEPVRDAGIVLAPALARWSAAPVAALFSPARPRGVGHALLQGVWPIAIPLSTVLALGFSVALFAAGGLVLLAVAAVAAVAVAAAVSRVLDGVTGDTFGASVEVTQAVVLLTLVAGSTRDWLDPTFLT